MLKLRSMAASDFKLLADWIRADHVREIWSDPADETTLRTEYQTAAREEGLKLFIVELEGKAVGFTQYYSTEESRRAGEREISKALLVPGDANSTNIWWRNEEPGTFGVDLLIGDPSLIGKGIGPKIINAVVEKITESEPTAKAVIGDPHPDNAASIRAFEKAGFIREATIQTPDGPAALLRRRLR